MNWGTAKGVDCPEGLSEKGYKAIFYAAPFAV